MEYHIDTIKTTDKKFGYFITGNTLTIIFIEK